MLGKTLSGVGPRRNGRTPSKPSKTILKINDESPTRLMPFGRADCDCGPSGACAAGWPEAPRPDLERDCIVPEAIGAHVPPGFGKGVLKDEEEATRRRLRIELRDRLEISRNSEMDKRAFEERHGIRVKLMTVLEAIAEELTKAMEDEDNDDSRPFENTTEEGIEGGESIGPSSTCSARKERGLLRPLWKQRMKCGFCGVTLRHSWKHRWGMTR